MEPYAEIIEACRKQLGAAPRRLPFLTKLLLKYKPPLWLLKAPQDKLWEQVHLQDKLLTEGIVVWGLLIQANSHLFKYGDYNHPASFVISFDPEADHYPIRLDALAEDIYKHKGTKPAAADMATLSDNITDEMSREAVPVSDRLVGLQSCHMLSILVIRKHLPLRLISGRYFPILTLPGHSSAAMILPSKYWDKRLKEMHQGL